ncbi:18447_t:CDS:2, partial [Funneliformis geosporum]
VFLGSKVSDNSVALPILPQVIMMSTGILTCYPSTTPFGLALGPD